MRNLLLPKLLGCYAGFLLAGLLPGVAVESWPLYVVGAALLALLYFASRLITRAVTLAFDLVFLGLPRLFLEAVILLGLSHLAMGVRIEGYWWAMLTLLLGLGGLTCGRLLGEKILAPA